MVAKRNKKTRRIGIIVALGLLICMAFAGAIFAEDTAGVKGDACYTYGDVNQDGRTDELDATYLLYHSMFSQEYPLEQSGDFDGDEKAISSADVLYLLEHFQDEEFEQIVHGYSEPVWTWSEDNGTYTATAHYKCACGEKEETVDAEDVTSERLVNATCTTAGSITYTATAVYDTVEYKITKTVVENALGHDYGNAAECMERTCQRTGCTHVAEAEAHTFGAPEEHAATCTTPAYNAYECTKCGFDYKEVTDSALGHSLGTDSVVERVEGDVCSYHLKYTCQTCNEAVYGPEYERHTYAATVTEEATCQHAGVKTYTCGECNHSYTEEIAKNADHAWVEVEVDNGITTYTCSHDECTASKTVVNASASTETTVSSDTLASAGAIEINNASIAMDEDTQAQLSQLEGDVEISAETTTANNLSLETDVAKQIGDNPIYNFTMTSNGEDIDFDGTLTVSIPYELQPGDDVDCIQIWYITDDGQITEDSYIEGTYSNGYVTFKTTHFSYYTVTRLTPEQRCEKFDHIVSSKVIAPTCEEDGYTLYVCSRCGKSWTDEETTKLGHDYKITTTEPTCTENGLKVQTCKREGCTHTIETEIPKTGHEWEATEEKEPTCKEAGYGKYRCKHENCSKEKEETLPQRSHEFEDETVDPTCEHKGYERHKCKHCDHEEREDKGAPRGHEYEATWVWDKENLKATLVLTCETCDKKIEKNANVSITKQSAATCSAEGLTAYLAQIQYNGTTYTDTYEIKEAMLEHKASAEYEYNGLRHYHICTLCGSKVEEADHTFDEGAVTQAATCIEDGILTYNCKCGYAKEEAIARLGHNYVNGKCSRCDAYEYDCEHDEFHSVEVNLADKGYPEVIVSYGTCECGKVTYLYDIQINEKVEDAEEYSKDELGYVVRNITYTFEDSELKLKMSYYWEVSEECVGTQYVHITATGKNNESLIDVSAIYYENEKHPYVVYSESEDLSAYGICEGTATKMSCPCGDCSYYNVDTECEWSWVSNECDEETTTFKCSECGIKSVDVWIHEERDNCKVYTKNSTALYKDDTKLVEFIAESLYDSHDYERTFELHGEECADDYTVVQTCKDCGHKVTEEVKSNGCRMLYTKILDWSEYDLCVDNTRVYECPCGNNSLAWDIPYDHNFGNYEIYKETETEDGYEIHSVRTCVDCGLTETYDTKVIIEDGACEGEIYENFTYSVGNTVLYSGTFISGHSEHDHEIIDYKILGDTCEDGLVLTYECKKCGDTYKDKYEDYHYPMKTASYDMSAYGTCGGTVSVYACACGQTANLEIEETDCAWEFYNYDHETGTEYYKCHKCEMEMQWSSQTKEIGNCQSERTQTIELIDGYDVVLAVSAKQLITTHNNAVTFELFGESCEDGYDVTYTCRDCGNVETYGTYYWHYTERLATYDMSEYGFCGGYIEYYSCACGESQGLNEWLEDCTWMWSSYEEETGKTTWKCTECGYYRSCEEKVIEQVGCKQLVDRIYTYYDQDEKELLSLALREANYNHTSEFSFVLNGDTCADGYYVTETCKYCEYYDSYYVQPEEGEHWTYRIKKYDMSEYGFCGGFIYENACPCGEEQWMDTYEFEISCNFTRSEQNGVEKYCCSECGGYYTIQRTWEEIDACHGCCSVVANYYSADDALMLAREYSYNYGSHDYLTTYELMGESCEDGYYLYQTCYRCGETTSRYDTYHADCMIAITDLSEKGMCEGYIREYGCACGEYRDTRYDFGCIFEWCWDDELKQDIWVCTECGTKEVHSETRSEKDAECYITVEYYREYYNADSELICSYGGTSRYKDCDYIWSFELLGTTCDDGYYRTGTCQDCGYVFTEETPYYGHEYHTTRNVELSQYGACEGAFVRMLACACGYEQYLEMHHLNGSCNIIHIDNYYEDEDGVGHNVEVRRCTECGLKVTLDYTFTVDEEKCLVTSNNVVTITVNDTLVETIEYVSNNESHNYEQTTVLMEGATNCEEGIVVTLRCKQCGDAYSYQTHWHERMDTDVVYDLSQYGSECGGYLVKTACACGEYADFEFRDTECDLDRDYEEPWLGADYEDQYTTEGWSGYFNREAGIYTCSVTEPQCGLCIRYCDYYILDEENCTLKSYTTWQLGYDREEGTYAEEVTFVTGTYTYHNYGETITETETEYISEKVCTYCQSSWTEKNTYDEDGKRLSWERSLNNTLNNGEKKEWIVQYEYVYYNDYEYLTSYYEWEVYADNREWWNRKEYTYDWENFDCTRIVNFTSSYGENYEGIENAHILCWFHNILDEGTCSQPYEQEKGYKCAACNELWEYEKYIEPNGHSYCWDDELGLYVCSSCGLENANGADGDIILEDMSAEYGNGENYVIGYYCDSNVDFTYYICVRGENDEEEALTGINVTELTRDEDGITALSFSMAEVEAAMEAAGVEGYLCIVFVPRDASGDLDYAITITEQLG